MFLCLKRGRIWLVYFYKCVKYCIYIYVLEKHVKLLNLLKTS